MWYDVHLNSLAYYSLIWSIWNFMSGCSVACQQLWPDSTTRERFLKEHLSIHYISYLVTWLAGSNSSPRIWFTFLQELRLYLLFLTKTNLSRVWEFGLSSAECQNSLLIIRYIKCTNFKSLLVKADMHLFLKIFRLWFLHIHCDCNVSVHGSCNLL